MWIRLVCFAALTLLGCDELSQRQKEQSRTEESSAPSRTAASSEEKRFIFPTKSAPFPEASVALDTTTGQLCKTYAWPDTPNMPSGLRICSGDSTLRPASTPQGQNEISFTPIPDSPLLGATKSYMGYTYIFDGKGWKRGSKALRYNQSTSNMDPNSDDQYDPLGLLSKDEKAKRLLSEARIAGVAKQFSVTYAEALEEAKSHGYQVPKAPRP
jgi:hypothetical protein